MNTLPLEEWKTNRTMKKKNKMDRKKENQREKNDSAYQKRELMEKKIK